MVRSSLRLSTRFALCLAASTFLLADGSQTGTLQGLIQDPQGNPIPGVQVRVAGPALMGERNLLTDKEGRFRFAKLPPSGDYTATVSREGFKTAAFAVRITLDSLVELPVTLVPLAVEVVQVQAEPAPLDTTVAVSTVSLSKRFVDGLPMPYGRDYQGVMAVTPGITGKDNPLALGGRRTENLYLVDGVDTTDAATGAYSMHLNEEAMEEVQVLTAALGAEYGRVGGAVANVVTKSGGNDFFGAIRYDFHNPAWDSRGKFKAYPDSKLMHCPFVSLGGPFIKDKLWFFLTGQLTRLDTLQSTIGPKGGASVPYERQFQADPAWYSAKLSWQINQNHWVSLQATGDPSQYSPGYDIYGNATTLDTLTKEKRDNRFISFTYQGVPSSNLNWDFKVAQEDTQVTQEGAAGDHAALIACEVLKPDFTRIYGNGPVSAHFHRVRKQLNASLTWYFGNHQFKLGADLQNTHHEQTKGIPGNVLFFAGYVINQPENKPFTPLFLRRYDAPKAQETSTLCNGYYLSDKWKLTPHWSFNIGLRFETATAQNDVGEEVWNYTTCSPRLGCIYDWKGNGKQAIGLFYARYALHPNLALVSAMNRIPPSYSEYGANANASQPTANPYDPTLYTDPGQAPAWSPLRAPKALVAPYADEFTLSFRKQLAGRFSLESLLVSRSFRNPLVIFRRFEQPSSTLPQQPVREIVNAGDAKRDYLGWVNAVTYQGDKWELLASYTLSSLKGNIDADNFDNAYEGISNNHNDGFGWFTAGSFIPAHSDRQVDGYLRDDQTHVFRLLANYRWEMTTKASLDNGVHLEWATGRRWTHMAYYQQDLPIVGPSDDPDWPNQHPVTQYGKRGDAQYPDIFRLHYGATFHYHFTPRLQGTFALRVMNLLNTFRVEHYNTDMTYTNGSFTPGAYFMRPSRYEDYTEGRQLRFSVGLRF